MISTRIGVILAGLLATGVCAQQTMVHPAVYSQREGTSWSSRPFGVYATTAQNRQVRYQQIHRGLSTQSLTIKGLALRRDGLHLRPWSAWSCDMELSLSTFPDKPIYNGAMSSKFADNVGPDAVTVIARKTIHFPASVNTGGLPEPTFAYKLPFDAGKSFVLAGDKVLCWDTKVYDNTVTKSNFDELLFDTSSVEERGGFSVIGSGCKVPGQTQVFAGTMVFKWASGVDFYLVGDVNHAPAGGYLFALLSPTSNPTGIPFGAPGCTLYVDPNAFLVVGPFTVDAQGGYSVNPASPLLYLPNVTSHYHYVIYGQWMAVDKAFTGIYASNGIKIQKGYRWPNGMGPGTSKVYYVGDVNATSGLVFPSYGLVTEITY